MIGGKSGQPAGAEIHVQIGIHEQVGTQQSVIGQLGSQIRVGGNAQPDVVLFLQPQYHPVCHGPIGGNISGHVDQPPVTSPERQIERFGGGARDLGDPSAGVQQKLLVAAVDHDRHHHDGAVGGGLHLNRIEDAQIGMAIGGMRHARDRHQKHRCRNNRYQRYDPVSHANHYRCWPISSKADASNRRPAYFSGTFATPLETADSPLPAGET